MEQIIQDLMASDKIDIVLKLTMVFVLGILTIMYRRWKVEQAKKETEWAKIRDINTMQNNNQSKEVQVDSKASDDFLKEEK